MPVNNANTRGVTGWCLEAHDLIVSKLVAGRDKDLDFTREALRTRLVGAPLLERRIASTALDDALRAAVVSRLTACRS